MIVGVPDHNVLRQTAAGWLNLAWEITIREVEEFQENAIVFNMIEEAHGRDRAEAAVQRSRIAAQYKLNNAISLLQQSLEIFLKARIAEVSPFLLIAGDPQSWPKPEGTGAIEFSNFRTLDAVQLCRVVKLVSTNPLADQFVEFYDRLRKARNKISHLKAGDIHAEANSILIDILSAHKYLFPREIWVDFRREYMISTGQYNSDDFPKEKDEDYVHENITRELGVAFDELDANCIKKFFKYDMNKKGFRCPQCLKLRTEDAEWTFAQRQRNGNIKCVACQSVYTRQEYKDKINEYFSYLDGAERRRIDEDVRREFP